MLDQRDMEPKPRKLHYNAFGPYKLLKTIGQGGFGKVKLAYHFDTNTEVAFSNSVKLYEVLETERYVGMVMEYACGGELFQYMISQERQYLKENEAAKYFSQLIIGVEYLLSMGIVHRDLKLENLLLDKDKNIVIIDFGFANWFQKGSSDLLSTSCGSLHYAAPELVMNNQYMGETVDIWSCGVILYAMLCGYLPYDDDSTNLDGEDAVKLYKYIMNTTLKYPSHVSSKARSLASSILVPDPKYRLKMEGIKNHPWCKPYYAKYFPYDIVSDEESHFPFDSEIDESVGESSIVPISLIGQTSAVPIEVPRVQSNVEDIAEHIRPKSVDGSKPTFAQSKNQLMTVREKSELVRSATLSKNHIPSWTNIVKEKNISKSVVENLKFHSGPIDQRTLSKMHPDDIKEKIIKVLAKMQLRFRETPDIYKIKVKKPADHPKNESKGKLANSLMSFPAIMIQNLIYMGRFGLQFNHGYDGKPVPERAGNEDLDGELKFTVAIHRLKNLDGLFTVDLKRYDGDIWEFKRLYRDFVMEIEHEL
ncbi:hypothetical protein HDV06_001404 [Boothiomyces sp. JEL0866]|nr:hypothetical protein HDV06_001404 [Boothiomyces sp. JEL0866]